MTKYEVAEIEEYKANAYAENNEPAFKCELNGKFYTYTDIDVDAPVVEIGDAENDEMFIIEWNGTGPVIRPRKMFPR